MQKIEVINKVAKKTNVEKDVVRKIFDASLEVISGALEEKRAITLRGFGRFFPQKRAEKKARDISREKTIVVPEHYRPVFKAYDDLKNRVDPSWNKSKPV
jgi:DNA-binding protein HU-beta